MLFLFINTEKSLKNRININVDEALFTYILFQYVSLVTPYRSCVVDQSCKKSNFHSYGLSYSNCVAN